MNTQESLQIADTIHAAAAADVAALGGVKKVAKLLWPTKDETTAQSRLRAALNESHPQDLSPDELEMLVDRAALIGNYNIVNYLARKARGKFERVEPRTRVERLVEVVEAQQRQFNSTCTELRNAIADLQAHENSVRALR